MKLTTRSLRLLDALTSNAPNMKLNEAYSYVKEHQEMDNDLKKYEFIIMQLFKALGYNDNGFLTDVKMSNYLKEFADMKIWQALSLASRIHCGYHCGIGGTEELESFGNKSLYGDELKRIEQYKLSSLKHIL